MREGVIQVENHPGVIFLRSDLENGTEPFAFLTNLGETNVTALVVIRNYTAKYPVPGTCILAILVKIAFCSQKLSRIRNEHRRDSRGLFRILILRVLSVNRLIEFFHCGCRQPPECQKIAVAK